MKKNALYFLIPFLLSFLSACWFSNKPAPTPEPQLPPETQEGKNTFGCMVNGEVWTLTYTCPGNDLEVYFDSGSFSVTASSKIFVNGQGECQSLGFGLDISKGLGKYDFTGYTDAWFANRRNYSSNPCKYGLVPDQEKPIEGFIEITKIDTQKQFIAGRFAFTLTKQGCDTVRVRDGRFDLRF